MRIISPARRLRLSVLVLLAAAGGAAFVAFGYAAPSQTSAQAQYAPANTAPPTISDTTPQSGQTLTASPGTWSGDQPIVFAYQWLRCNAGGQNCVPIPNATLQQYTVQATDVANTLRVRVTGTNASGSSTADSAATSQVTAAPAPPPPPPPGSTIPVTDVNAPNRLTAAEVRFEPNPIRLSTQSIDVRVRVRDTRGFLVSGALVFVRSTPLVTSSASEARSGNDGWATVRLNRRSNYRIIRLQDNLQMFVRVRKEGDNLQAGVSGRRLVQVRIAR
jgi:hypothetical protein